MKDLIITLRNISLMATIKFQTEVARYCPNCGSEFSTSQPEKDAINNIISCGDNDDMGGCGFKFIIKPVDE